MAGRCLDLNLNHRDLFLSHGGLVSNLKLLEFKFWGITCNLDPGIDWLLLAADWICSWIPAFWSVGKEVKKFKEAVLAGLPSCENSFIMFELSREKFYSLLYRIMQHSIIH